MARDAFVAVSPNASGITFAQLRTGGWPVALELLAAANPAKADPTTQLTANPTGGGSSGGNLPAGTYYACETFVDPFGETLIGTSRSALISIAAGNIPRITGAALPSGCQSKNLYLTPVGGAAGSEYLYASGITATTFDCSFALASDPGGSIPRENTTGLAGHMTLLRSLVQSNAGVTLLPIRQGLDNFLQGVGIDRRTVLIEAIRNAGLLAAWAILAGEIGTLIAANMGTLAMSTTGSVNTTKLIRQFS